jgi:serine/threonine protein phosphatase PrpC
VHVYGPQGAGKLTCRALKPCAFQFFSSVDLADVNII